MKSHFFKRLFPAALLVFHFSASAEDTDLFVGASPAAIDLPNVLIVLDNTANWNNAFTNEIAALKTVISGLPVNADGTAKFRLGFMLFTESGGSNSGRDGGYIRAAVRNLNTDYKNKLVALLSSFDKLDDKSNGGKLGNTMTDAYRYFSGGEPFSGNNKTKADYAGNTSGNAASNAIYALAGNALDSKADTSYTSAVPDGSCAKNFIIYISNGPAQDNNSDTVDATTALKAAAGGGTAGDAAAAAIALSPSGSQENVGDEWARFMRKSSLGVVTYTIDVDKGSTGQGPGWSALLKSMASVSSGKYFDVSSASLGSTILKAMEDIFSEIQSVNSVFAAVSLPVSVNTQGTFRNQVYIGMFRPDVSANPRWDGNLKQYKLGYINNTLKLVDADAKSAINSNTGFITECARSFWTPSTADTYWDFRPLGGCLAVSGSDASNYPDGNIVDKGAQAYKLRSDTTRPVKTCSTDFSACTTLIDFNNTNVSQSALGATSTTERDALINWARGLNTENEGSKGTSVMRPSSHGDVVHSRPVAINFGTEIDPKVVVFYGGNDGVLRAVNGNRTSDIGSTPAGDELWAFIPPEFFPYIKRIRDNNIKIDFPNNNIVSHTPLPKPYGIDGAISAFKDADNAWIYATMRRGGRALYAFNVDPSDPSDITLKWKRGCPNPDNDDNCSEGFAGIGQTWSSPKAFTAVGFESGTAPLLLVGGGYDKCEDEDQNTCTSSSKGRYVYVINANTGELLKTLETDRGVVADIFIVPDENTGKIKHAYAADLGGNVYRINIGALAPEDWTITKIASLGCDTTATCTANRKFMFSPDVIEDDGTYTLLIGSGDREKPLNSVTYPSTMSVANHFFMFKDKPSDAIWLSSETANCGSAVICKASLYPILNSSTPTSADLATKKGWYLGLRNITRDGKVATEQVVTSAITVFDVVTFSTHIPAIPVAGACTSTLGNSAVYNIDYKNAKSPNGATASRYEPISGGGLPPSPVAGMVTLDDGSTVPFCIGCKPDSPLEGGDPPGLSMSIQPKARVYWYIQK
ncbi:pilus assembly protein PilY [Oxalobacteraceae bacterium R-40]|uniref:Pilus assembly protein PilY n=1 Tax=Keguizhuia sedimenti TaxID=3064264 RepID=A0ABU1BLS7_9BURK|nr:pilus assembly protein PilY [Oxalobacteraceae bacterium R-40]